MLTHSKNFMEAKLEEVRHNLDAIVMKETTDLIKDWAKRYPRYEVEIGCHDLPNFRYKEIGVDGDWKKLELYSNNHYSTDLRRLAAEADAFSDAYCELDTRFGASIFGWVNTLGEKE